MKPHILIILMFILYQSNANAQFRGNIGIGYGLGTHIKADGLDFVIGRYNDTRAYLTTTMNEPRFFRGLNIATELYFPKCLVDLEFIGRKSDVFAEVASTNERRDFRYQVNTYNFGCGIKTGKNKTPIGFYPGIDFSTISIKNFTRAYVTTEDKPDYEKINWDLIIGFSPFLQYVGNRLTSKLYYQFMLNEQDFWYVNQAINPFTWSGDVFESNQGKTTTIGICMRFNVWKNDKDDY